MIAKSQTHKSIKNKIDLYAKRYTIIIQVLDIINKKENEKMFEEEDTDLNNKNEAVKKEWEEKKALNKRQKKVKDNFNDFDYFAAHADW